MKMKCNAHSLICHGFNIRYAVEYRHCQVEVMVLMGKQEGARMSGEHTRRIVTPRESFFYLVVILSWVVHLPSCSWIISDLLCVLKGILSCYLGSTMECCSSRLYIMCRQSNGEDNYVLAIISQTVRANPYIKHSSNTCNNYLNKCAI